MVATLNVSSPNNVLVFNFVGYIQHLTRFFLPSNPINQSSHQNTGIINSITVSKQNNIPNPTTMLTMGMYMMPKTYFYLLRTMLESYTQPCVILLQFLLSLSLLARWRNVVDIRACTYQHHQSAQSLFLVSSLK